MVPPMIAFFGSRVDNWLGGEFGGEEVGVGADVEVDSRETCSAAVREVTRK